MRNSCHNITKQLTVAAIMLHVVYFVIGAIFN